MKFLMIYLCARRRCVSLVNDWTEFPTYEFSVMLGRIGTIGCNSDVPSGDNDDNNGSPSTLV